MFPDKALDRGNVYKYRFVRVHLLLKYYWKLFRGDLKSDKSIRSQTPIEGERSRRKSGQILI